MPLSPRLSMQTITMYLRAASVRGTLVDEWNQQLTSLPALTRGMRAELVLKLVDSNGDPLSGLDAYASWDFAVADDWDTSTTPQLRVTEGIAVEGNAVRVPLTETNTQELIAALGTNESATFGCELAGFEAGDCLEGVPDLPVAPQDEAGLTKTFQTWPRGWFHIP